jgi:hypothetical protein
MKISEEYRKLEPLAFLFFALLGAVPVLIVPFFPTLDGPAHQYNAKLVGYLLTGHESQINSYFMFSRELLPNWFGHVLLFFFNLFLPSVYAVKAVLLCYVIGLPLAFRYMATSIQRDNVLLTYLIFPFVYTLFFLLGFYNFNMALVLLFLASGYWIRSGEKPGGFRYAGMFLLIVCTYFSHLFVFVVLMMALGLYEAGGLIRNFRDRFRKSLLLAIISLPCVLLCLIYLRGHELPHKTYLPWKELTNYIRNFSPLITLDANQLIFYTRSLVWLLLLVALTAYTLRLVYFLRQPKESRSSLLNSFKGGDGWLLLSIVLLVLYYFLPDSDGIAGYVSLRLCLLVFLALLAWISQQNLPGWVVVPALLVTFAVFQKQITYHIQAAQKFSPIAEEVKEASRFLEPNKVVLPLDYSGNWILGHLSNYLGHEKPVVLLEDYEASLPFFPVHFVRPISSGQPPESPVNQCNSYPWDECQGGMNTIDYIFIYGNAEDRKDSCNKQADIWIKDHFTQIYSSNWTHLYRKK